MSEELNNNSEILNNSNSNESANEIDPHTDDLPALFESSKLKADSKPIIEIKDLTVKVHGRTLIKNASQQIFSGQTVLLVGGSGTGKSVLMKILLGLISPTTPGFEIAGKILINEQDILSSYPTRIKNLMGIVFQDFALFDEFNAKQNIRFAYDHSVVERSAYDRKTHLKSLMKTLSLNLKTPIAKMSGGEKRRLAIARTLAFDPEIILYDEPTTGLDPLNSERVAQHIGKLSVNYRKTSIVVTHDYEYLREVADKVILIDPIDKSLRDLNPEDAEVDYVKEILKTKPKDEIEKTDLLTKVIRSINGFFASSSRVLEELLMIVIFPVWWLLALFESSLFKPLRKLAGKNFKRISVTLALIAGIYWLTNLQHMIFGGKYSPQWMLDFLGTKYLYLSLILTFLILLSLLSSGIAPSWKRFKWGIRFFWHYLKLSTLSTSLIYIGLAGLIGGFIATYFLYEYFPYRSYTEPLLRDDVLRALGFLSFRVLIPALVTILIAARSGAAIAADVGNRVYSHQVDAMRTFNISSKVYWSANIFGALIIGCPILMFVAYATSAVSSGFAFLVTHPDDTLGFWWSKYTYDLFETGKLLPVGFWWVFSKSMVCFMGIALISNVFGMRKKNSSTSVSVGITQTIWWATLFVLFVHMMFAFFEFNKLQ